MKTQINTRLLDARFDAGLSIKQVEELLGHSTGRILSRCERGYQLPSLVTAVKLEIIYHRPLAYLFPELYERLRTDVRAHRASNIDATAPAEKGAA